MTHEFQHLPRRIKMKTIMGRTAGTTPRLSAPRALILYRPARSTKKNYCASRLRRKLLLLSMEKKDTIIKTESIRLLYLNLMDLLVKHNINSKHLVLFDSIHGIDYHSNSVELLVVGRANNGWDNYFNPAFEKDKTLEQVNTYRNLKLEHMEKRGDLLATVSNWKNKPGKGYNFNRSQFWRVTKRVAKTITKTNSDAALNCVCYSNLYKVAFDGKNPSVKIKRSVYKNNLNILKDEIELYKPKRILFLTGYEGWAKDFIQDLAIVGLEKPIPKIHFSGTLNGAEVIVVDHPQGKAETPIVEAILSLWNLTPAHVKAV